MAPPPAETVVSIFLKEETHLENSNARGALNHSRGLLNPGYCEEDPRERKRVRESNRGAGGARDRFPRVDGVVAASRYRQIGRTDAAELRVRLEAVRWGTDFMRKVLGRF